MQFIYFTIVTFNTRYIIKGYCLTTNPIEDMEALHRGNIKVRTLTLGNILATLKIKLKELMDFFSRFVAIFTMPLTQGM